MWPVVSTLQFLLVLSDLITVPDSFPVALVTVAKITWLWLFRWETLVGVPPDVKTDYTQSSAIANYVNLSVCM